MNLHEKNNLKCLMMAALGYSAKFIEQETQLTSGQIRYRLKYTDIRLRKFRNGESPLSKTVLEKATTSAQRYVIQQIPSLKEPMRIENTNLEKEQV